MKSIIALVLSSQVAAHMHMEGPAPRNFKGNPYVQNIDYDIDTPITIGEFPCKNVAPLASTTTVQAGSSLQVTLAGGAPHNGGNCEFSVSYDQKTWVVLKTVLGNCMMPQLTYDVPIPSTAPNGKVSFSWSWVNRSGNREFYQNCADITVAGGQDGGSFTGPQMVVANIGSYPAIEEIDDMNVIPGQKYYENRPNVSISPNGGSVQPAIAQTTSQPAATQPYVTPSTISSVEPQATKNNFAEQPSSVAPSTSQLPIIQNTTTPAPSATSPAPQPAVNPTTIAPITAPYTAPYPEQTPQVQPTQPVTIPQVQPTQTAVVSELQPVVPQAHKKKCKKHN